MEMTGMYLRAMEQDTLAGEPNSSPMWAGIRVLTDTTFRYKLVNGAVLGDLREEGYNDMFVALCAAYDPYAPHAAACRSDLNAEILNTWEPQRQPDGSWSAVAGLYASPGFNSSFPDVSAIEPGTVTVAPGSVAVTISGGTWNPSWFSDPGNTSEFFSVYTPTDYTTRDSVTYVATYVDSTHLQLNQPYVDACSTGTNSCSGRQWILSSNGNGSAWVGFGIQPFMLGIDGDFFLQAYYGLSADPNHAYASTAALVKGYVSDVANWIVEHGYDPATRGLRYGVGFGVCNPGTIAQGCLDDTTPARELTPEAMGALVSAYALAPNPTLLGSIDNLFSALYAKYRSDPGYDGTYAQDLDPLNSGYFWGTDNAKWNGFFWGMGRTAGWLSARQGATLPVR
jgi:hypothetical protein